MKGQSGVFDGIFFLLVVTVSITMMFSFASKYGSAQTQVLDTHRNLNFISALMKSVYYLDASSLAEIKYGDNQHPALTTSPYYGMDCSILKDFKNTLVSDLVKRDLNDLVLDNRYAEGNNWISAPGKMALRCALYEFMRPYETGGLKYFVEIQTPRSSQSNIDYAYPTQKEIQHEIEQNSDNYSIVTNSFSMTNPPGTKIRTCDDLKAYTGELYVISVPFRIFTKKDLVHNPDQEIPDDAKLVNNTFKLSFCMWPANINLK